MKKLATHFLAIVFFGFIFNNNNLAFGQVVIDWQKCFGGTAEDQPYSFKQTPDSGYILIGYTFSTDGDVTMNHGYKDMWLIKTDKDGNIVWQKTFGGTSSDDGYSIDFTADGGFILCGNSGSIDGDVSGNHGMLDVWLVRTDSLGNIIWQNSYGGNKDEIGNSVIATNDGGFVVAGRTGTSSNGNVVGYYGNNDFWVFKVDSVGTFLWQRCLGGSLYDQAFSIKATIDNGYIIAGSTRSLDHDLSSGWVTGEETWIVKIDSVGNIIWNRTFGGTDDESYHSVILTSDGGYLMVGKTTSYGPTTVGFHGYQDVYVVKVNSLGFVEWQKCFGGINFEFANNSVETASGDFLIGASTYSLDGDANGNTIKGAWVLRISAIGNLIWQKTFGGVSLFGRTTELRDLIINNEEGITILSSTIANDGDISGNHGYYDFWLVKLTEQYNIISGNTFIDSNLNNMYDSSEVVIKNLRVEENLTAKYDFTDSIGNFKILVTDTGAFDFSPVILPYYNFAPTYHSAVFNSSAATDSLNNFAFQPIGLINDLCINITPMGQFRSGFSAYYSINYSNVGTTTLNPTIIFYPDTNLNFANSIPAPSTIATDSIVWNLGPISPFEDGIIVVATSVSQGLPINTIINSGAVIEPIAGDSNGTCNQSYWEVLVTGSFDPNDILVNRKELLSTELATPPYLHYVIRFQNTGNDTAFVVRIENEITNLLDLTSFEIVTTSHPVDVKFIKQSRLMEFNFSNILLPDSNVNEQESHGFVRYKIKPLSTLIVGNTILNKAGIYFDFNHPVLTNTAVTEIISPVSTYELNTTSNLFNVYPNPFLDEINVLIEGMKGEHATLGVYDVYGRRLLMLLEGNIKDDNFQMKSDLSKLSSGIYFIQLKTSERMKAARIVKGN